MQCIVASTSQRPKVLRNRLFERFALFTSKRASRHNGATACPFSTSQWSEHMVLLASFSILTKLAWRHDRTHFFDISSQPPKVLAAWCAFAVFTSTCASRHSCVHFLIPHLPRWLGTCRFSEPVFRPSGATTHWTNAVLGDFSTFPCTFWSSFLWLFLFWLLLFSDSSSRLLFHVVGSLTSKLPSIRQPGDFFSHLFSQKLGIMTPWGRGSFKS